MIINLHFLFIFLACWCQSFLITHYKNAKNIQCQTKENVLQPFYGIVLWINECHLLQQAFRFKSEKQSKGKSFQLYITNKWNIYSKPCRVIFNIESVTGIFLSLNFFIRQKKRVPLEKFNEKAKKRMEAGACLMPILCFISISVSRYNKKKLNGFLTICIDIKLWILNGFRTFVQLSTREMCSPFLLNISQYSNSNALQKRTEWHLCTNREKRIQEKINNKNSFNISDYYFFRPFLGITSEIAPT